jgi:hypothetical protein
VVAASPALAASPGVGRELGFPSSELGFLSVWARPVALGGPAQQNQLVRSGSSLAVRSDARHVG